MAREKKFSIYTILDRPKEKRRHHIVKRALSFDKEPVYDAATDIHRAIIGGNIVQLEKVLDEQPGDINCLDHQGKAPIHLAVYQDNVHALRTLVQHGADINMRDSLWGEPPLHIAVKIRSLDCVQVLVRAGCAMNLTDYWGATPVHHMIWSDSMHVARLELEIIKVLLQQCPSLATCKNYGGRTFMWCLVTRKMGLGIFQSLLSLLIDLGAWTESNEEVTRLVLNAFSCDVSSEKFSILVEAGASLEGVYQTHGLNILHWICEGNSRSGCEHEMIEYLRTQTLKSIQNFKPPMVVPHGISYDLP